MALILGFFAASWFGWAQATPTGFKSWLAGGAVLSLLICAAGLVLVVRNKPSRRLDPSTNRRYGIIVGIEFTLCGAGSAVLGVAGLAQFIPALVAAVVGLHFIPLAPVLHDPPLVPLGVAVTAVAVAAAIGEPTAGIAPSTIAGSGTGTALLVYAAAALIRAWVGRAPIA
ncbi:hypothetical protein [Krasilnikovia sp. M28-CT-15]|uniref:hypothetical protein n=1 Tax=Krasilnikovia sp. M28-CT-15 TaxID=3373540 RepID=UPI003876F8A0